MAMARQARADAERGMGLPEDTLTVQEHLRDWLATRIRPSVRARTYESYRSHCELYIVTAIGRIRLIHLAPGHVQHMLAELLNRGLSETTVKHVRSTLSGALRAAQLDHGLPRNAASLAKMPKSDRPAFTPEEISPSDARKMLDAFKGSRLEPLVLFAVATGLRQGEQLALRWKDVDLERRTISIRYAVEKRDGKRKLARPKTERAKRTLRLPDMAMHALELRRAQEEEEREAAGPAWEDMGLVFPGPTGGIRDGCAVTRNFKAYLDRRGMEPIRWHALRRVIAAVLQDQGVPLERIRDLMGHSQLRVTESYAYTIPETLQKDMDAVDDALGPSGDETHSAPDSPAD